MTKGTELYQQVINYEGKAKDITSMVWEPTPYMMDVYTGGRRYEMQGWLTERWGRACSPIHEREGLWQFGNATIDGYTWLGFATEEMMQEFLEHWPQEEGN